MKPKHFSRFRADILFLGSILICSSTVVHATDYDWTGISDASWGVNTNWTAAFVPVAGDTILINRDLPAATMIVKYSTSGVVTRSIDSITINDTNNGSGSGAQFNFNAGITGSQLQFATATPSVTTNIINQNSGANRLTIQNPLFQSGTTFTKGGTGNVRLDFALASGVTNFNSNVSTITSSGGGALWLSAPSANTMTLPNISFSANNTKLVLTTGTFTATGKTINTGTNSLTMGSGATLTTQTGTALTAGALRLGSGSSAEFYVAGSTTMNVSGGTAAFGGLELGVNALGTGTSTLNVNGGAATVTSNATTLGGPGSSANGAQTQNSYINVSSGSLGYTYNTAVFDISIGRNDRTATGGTPGVLTIAGAVTISGTGTMDLGSFGRLSLGRDVSTANGGLDNTTGELHLNGGTLRTAQAITRGSNTSTGGADHAKVFLNGGTLTTTAAVTDLFTGFTAKSADGVYISSNGAVINTNGFASGIAGKLQENSLSTGGGLTKQGANTLTLTGTANTFTGGISIEGGTLAFNNSNALGAGNAAITQSAGTRLQSSASATVTRAIVIAGHNANTYVAGAASVVRIQGGISKESGYGPGASDVYGLESVGTTIIETTAISLPTLQINKGQSGTLEFNVAGNSYKRFWNYTGTTKTGIAGALDATAQFDNRTTGSILDLNGNSQGVASLVGSVSNGAGSVITSAAAATLTINPSSGTFSYAGAIDGSLRLVKSGAGTQVLSGANGFNGTTSISGGTLAINGAGSINNSAVTLSGGTFLYNSSVAYTGTLTYTSGTVAGTNLSGSLGSLTIGSNQVLSPGNSPGTAATTSQTWAGGGSYLWEINNATGSAGSDPGWDLVTGSGSLDITATSGSPFSILVNSLTLANAAGLAGNFVPSNTYNWMIADFLNTITSFDAAKFTIVTSDFDNSFSGIFRVARGDSGTIGGDGSQIYLTYSAVPEPNTAMLAGGLGLLGLLRRRRA